MNKVLVIDPQENLKDQLRHLGASRLAFHPARSTAAARQLLQRIRCQVALVAFAEPTAAYCAEIEEMAGDHPGVEWIAMVTPESMEEPALRQCVARTFLDYHTLPIDPQRLAWSIGHALGKARLRHATGETRPGDSGRFGICGASPAMQELFRQLDKVLSADLPVLIGGESGTGKELVAQAIHGHSGRAEGPMVVVNCGAIPPSLIHSELFGHEKGAFTGALQRKIGSIEAANGGVLFLDEIGDLPQDLQASLLRVLQERSITRVGATQRIPVDFRIVAATHVDLEGAIAGGRFRQDLYYRLNVVHLTLPPLRERGADVQLLADLVLRKYARSHNGCRAAGFSGEARRAMSAYPWPGNVRELINRVQRAAIMCENRLIRPADLGLDDYRSEGRGLSLEDARASFERDIIETSLRANGNNMSETARQLGVSRVTLYRMLNRGGPGRVRT